MRRSVTLISVGITAFSIVLLASAIYGAGVAASPRPVPAPAAVAGALDVRVSPELQDAAGFSSPSITPQAAVDAASKYLERTDAFSVQLTDYKGQLAYKVTFSSGDVVYVSLSGQILDSVPAVFEMASANTGRKDWDSHGGGGGEEHSEEHEDEEEHDSEAEAEGGD